MPWRHNRPLLDNICKRFSGVHTISTYMNRYILVLTILLGVVGCATTGSEPNIDECDPTTGGFVGGAGALSSGCYEKRVEHKEAKLSKAKSLTEELNQENRNLTEEKTASTVSLVDLRQKIAVIERENAQLAASLTNLTSGNAAGTSEIAALQERLNSLNASLAEAKNSNDGAALARRLVELEKERDQLADEISEAMMGS